MFENDSTGEMGDWDVSSLEEQRAEDENRSGTDTYEKRQPNYRRKRRRGLLVLAACLVVIVLSISLGWFYLKPEEDDDNDASLSSNVEDFYGRVATESAEFVVVDPPPQDVEAWLAATVTIQDGVMFEVEGDPLLHDPDAFSQGLTYDNETDTLYESTGLRGESDVRRLNSSTGQAREIVPMDPQYFGEGLTHLPDDSGGKLVQLTWKSQTAFVYNASNISETPQAFPFSTFRNQGWGLTYDSDKHEFIVSDGSQYLHFWNATTFQELRRVPVLRQDGTAAIDMNELEYWRGRVLANVWYSEVVLVIHPETGLVEKEYDCSTLWPESDRNPQGAGVLNGISSSADPDLLYMTGKNWDRMFRVRLLV